MKFFNKNAPTWAPIRSGVALTITALLLSACMTEESSFSRLAVSQTPVEIGFGNPPVNPPDPSRDDESNQTPGNSGGAPAPQPSVQPSILPAPVVSPAPVISPSPSSSPSPSASPSPDVADDDVLADGIWVRVAAVELIVTDGRGKRQTSRVAENLGLVNFSAFDQDAFQRLGKISLTVGSVFQELRVITELSGHYWVRDGRKICDVFVPSGTASGAKLKNSGVRVEPNLKYLLSVQIDSTDIVQRGDGMCNLRPTYFGEIMAY